MSDPTILEIQQAVSDAFQVPLIEMRSHRRSRSVARPRQVAMYLARHLTVYSLPNIGRLFGGRDHSTVMHAIKRIEELARSDADFGARVADIRQQISGDRLHESASGDAGMGRRFLQQDVPPVPR